MGLLGFFKARSIKIDFSDKNVEHLGQLTDQLGDTLIKAGYGSMVDYLSKIRLAADRHDTETFRKLVISPNLFGCSGAMWEVSITDQQLQTKFKKQFCTFIDHLREMGIDNKRMNQVRKGMDLLHND